MCSLDVARIWFFLLFSYCGTTYPCALVHWYSHIGDKPDEKTGMWIVQPEVYEDRTPSKGSSISTASCELHILLGFTEQHASLKSGLSMTHWTYLIHIMSTSI